MAGVGQPPQMRFNLTVADYIPVEFLTPWTIGAVAAALVLSALVALNVWTIVRVGRIEQGQRDLAQRLAGRADRRDLATSAVAAALLTSYGQEIRRQDIQAEVEAILQSWDNIEDMAEDACKKIEEARSDR